MAAPKGTSKATRAGLMKAGRAAARVYEDGSVKGRVGGNISSPGKVVGKAAGRAASGARAMSRAAKAKRR